MAAKNQNNYHSSPYPEIRWFAIDAGRSGRRKHIIHGLIEIDITKARQPLDSHNGSRNW
jgi:hypothetical protein